MKTVLITGCSSGIGQAAAELFAAQGWNVVATARDPLALSCFAANANLALLRLDVTDESSISSAVAAAIERFGAIDVLVNNAGYGLFGPLEGYSSAQLELQLRTNVVGAAALIRGVLPFMRERRSGTIINVSSLGGQTAAPFASAYHASKFALEGLSESLRYETSLHGVRVKLVEPAHFKTGFFARSLQRVEHAAYGKQFANYMGWAMNEDREAAGPQQVAQAILRAAADPSNRLRYRVGGSLVMALIAILPDAMWRSFMSEGMTRRPRGSLTATTL